MNPTRPNKRLWRLTYVAALLCFMALIPYGTDPAAQEEVTGCAVSPTKSYSDGFTPDDFERSNVFTDDEGDFFLETAAQQINPDRIIIPTTQEVFTTFIYEAAGYKSDFGYVRLEDVVEKDDEGNILYKKEVELETMLIEGGGSDIWNTADQFHYEYHDQDGNFDARLKVHSLENTNGWAKMGLMVREDLDDDSQHAMMVVTPSNGYSFQYRDSKGGDSSNGGSQGSASYPSWVRLVRNGDTMTGYRSTDGENWVEVGSHTFPSSVGRFSTNNVHLGIAITSHNNGTLCTAEISDYEVDGATGQTFTGEDIGTTDNGSLSESGDVQIVYEPYNKDEDDAYPRDAYGMLIEKFVGWANVPDDVKHPIFVKINADSGGQTVLQRDAHLSGYTDRPTSEDALDDWEDGTGLRFISNGDGTINEKDMRKSLGTFEANTELVFFLSANHRYNEADSGSYLTYFSKEDWNPDVYDSTLPDDESAWCLEAQGGNCTKFNKRYKLGVAGGESWRVDAGWMTQTAINSLRDNFDVVLEEEDEYIMTIEDGKKYEHVVVGAPANDPNQWILGFEDLKGGGDTDHNDTVFRIERKTGGSATLKAAEAIKASETDEDVYYTGVTFEAWDYMPCDGKTWITYSVSIDGGTTWVDIVNNEWDIAQCLSLDANEDFILGQSVDDWRPGNSSPTCTQDSASPSPYTYRSKRIDFAGRAMIGKELIWRAQFQSEDENCVPEILDVNLEGSVARHASFSRSSPVVQANVLYSGTYETPNPNDTDWILEPTLRGHVVATRLYDPTDAGNPTGVATSQIWDAGQQLADMDVDDRNIYFPGVTTSFVDREDIYNTDDWIKTGAKTFVGKLANPPVSSGTLKIFLEIDGQVEIFRDKFTTDLTGDKRGVGTLNRFTGHFELIVNDAVADGAEIVANASYVKAPLDDPPTRQEFTTGNAKISADDGKDLMGLNHRYSSSESDFDSDGDVDNADKELLVKWVRGYKTDGTTEKAWPLGPVDHSVPALQTPPGIPAWFYGTAITSEQKESYNAFRGDVADDYDDTQTTIQKRPTVLYVGARDGMLHAFDAGKFRWAQKGAKTGDNPETALLEKRGYFLHDSLDDAGVQGTPQYGTGEELWAWIPAGLLPKLKNNLLKKEDQAFVDASPTVVDVYAGGQWRTVVLSALGNGGDTVFCLDVTDPLNPVFMWEYANQELFRSRSSPSVAAVGQVVDGDGNPAWAAFFVSGKVADDEYPSVFVIDIGTGAPMNIPGMIGPNLTPARAPRIVLNTDPNGVGGIASGQPAMVDSDFNGYVDRLYIGTNKGNLYKINLPDDPGADTPASISHGVINGAFTDADGNTITDANGDAVADSDKGHAIYGSPTVVVDNGINDDGSIDYNVRVFFGTGDSPYADENINTENTRYHFFAYLDTDNKGGSNAAALDWFFTMPAGERVWASAFASAGKIYFGSTTAETEDPCAGYQADANTGSIYALDMAIEDPADATPISIDVGDNVGVAPVVYDEHIFAKKPSGEVDVIGDGQMNNEVKTRGVGQSDNLLWREVTDY